MEHDDMRFYKRREAEALRLAQDAVLPGVQAIHREMAKRYGEMAEQAMPVSRPRPTLRIVQRP